MADAERSGEEWGGKAAPGKWGQMWIKIQP